MYIQWYNVVVYHWWRHCKPYEYSSFSIKLVSYKWRCCCRWDRNTAVEDLWKLKKKSSRLQAHDHYIAFCEPTSWSLFRRCENPLNSSWWGERVWRERLGSGRKLRALTPATGRRLMTVESRRGPRGRKMFGTPRVPSRSIYIALRTKPLQKLHMANTVVNNVNLIRITAWSAKQRRRHS